MGSTKVELVAALKLKPRGVRRDALIAAAERGDYHDFDSPHDLPKAQLVEDLEGAGFTDLARLAAQGEYDDEPPNAAQRAELEAMWSEMQREDPEGARKLADFGRSIGAPPPPANRAARRARRS